MSTPQRKPGSMPMAMSHGVAGRGLKNVCRGICAISLVTMTALSLMPAQLLPVQAFDWWDKAQHALGFAWVTVWGLLGWPASKVRCLVFLCLWGGFIEVAQSVSGWRHGDPADWVADVIGIGLAWAFVDVVRPMTVSGWMRR